jgi:hypothetical protein
MCVCGWQLVAVAVAVQVMAIAYGDIEGRRRSDADWLALRCRLADFTASGATRPTSKPNTVPWPARAPDPNRPDRQNTIKIYAR